MAFNFRCTRYSAFSHFLLGFLCIIFGIADRATMYKIDAFHTEGVIAIWMGVWFLITGVLGVFATKRIPDSERPRTSMINAYLVLSIISTVFAAGLLICYGIGVAIILEGLPCSSQSTIVEECPTGSGIQPCFYVRVSQGSKCRASVGLGSMIIIFAVSEFAVGLWSSISCCTAYRCCCCDTSSSETTMVTGCIGVCASGYRHRRDTCQVVTFFIFSMMIAGLSSYTIFNFSRFFSLKLGFTSSTTVYMLIGAAVLGLAIVVLLLSCWTMICCLASLCCDNEIAPEPERQQPVVTGQQGAMMQGTVMVPMMRTNTVPIMQYVNPNVINTEPTMVQAVPTVMQVKQSPMAQIPQAPEIQSVPTHHSLVPVQVVASPAVVKCAEQHDVTVV